MSTSPSLPVKKLESFSQNDSGRPLLQNINAWFAAMLCCALLFTAAVAANAQLGLSDDLEIGLCTALFIAGVLCGTRIVDITLAMRAKQLAQYEAYLSSVECSTLKSVALSPEYDEVSKAAIIKHLSARQPGWSIQQQE